MNNLERYEKTALEISNLFLKIKETKTEDETNVLLTELIKLVK